MAQLDETVAENCAGFKDLVRDLNATLADTRQALNAAHVLLAKSQTRIPETIDHLQALISGIQENRRQLTSRLDKLLVNMDSVVVQNDRNLYETIENLRYISEHLEATAEMVRANPAVVIWGRRGDDTGPRETNPPAQTLGDRGRIGRYDRER